MVVGCSASGGLGANALPQSQLQLRQIQTREYDPMDKKILMKILIDVLQDDNFMLKNAIPELGLLIATRSSGFSSLDATAHLIEFGGKIRVRVSFQNTTALQPYQDFFAKVDKGVFLYKQGL